MRALKAAGIFAVALFVAVAMGPADDKDAYAGGGINYKTTLKNPTRHRVKVVLLVDRLAVEEERERVIIEPGNSYTWQTGALCPVYFQGAILNPETKNWVQMQRWGLFNNYHTTSHGEFPLCASSSWKVCRKQGNKTVNRHDFGFCKQ